MSSTELKPTPRETEAQSSSAAPLAPLDEPTPEELSVLAPMERVAFRVTRRMNQGGWKRFWTFCQRTVGMSWIRVCTYNLMRVHGIEHVEAVSHERPILLVANHRSFFDMYTVAAELFRRTSWEKSLFFPVRGRFFYESPLGMLVNMLMGWWSMYPPFFAAGSNPIPEKRDFDKYSMRVLVDLCQQGRGHLIGFHPEGTRNKNPDPYTFLPAKPGVGRLIKDATPQVIPVFVAGLNNDLPRQVLGNWTGGELIRIHFGAALDYTQFLNMRDGIRTYKEIAEFVMSRIAELGEQDRAMYGKEEGIGDEE
ncbi:MAG TPA: lysophospholipid acyltransferase family protein [Pyrinomonadaceae bacterium]|nr:lysophospholipid acyltransferase family protein [Pyrinomonadaceae bacterium]